MARYLMIAFNGPTGGDGDAQALETWYEEEHLPGILSDHEVLSARRYKVESSNLPGAGAWPFVSVYEMETNDIAALNQRIAEKLGPVHPSLDRSRSATLLAIKVMGED